MNFWSISRHFQETEGYVNRRNRKKREMNLVEIKGRDGERCSKSRLAICFYFSVVAEYGVAKLLATSTASPKRD
jgi:hypothetical protein